MNEFYFLGKAPFSKSLLNRALIVQSWFPDFKIAGDSKCEDILIMKDLVKNIHKQTEFYCGLSGTAFRFFSTRLSRNKGTYFIKADPALLDRPLDEISSFLSQLSVSVEKTKQGFVLSSEGWKVRGDGIYIPGQKTSQHASALLLNSWNLEQDLFFVFNSNSVSYSYFLMTLKWIKSLGLKVRQNKEEFFIPKGQTLKTQTYKPEQDQSCLFALACFAVFNGQAVFLDWDKDSLQPDSLFPEILQRMGAVIEFKDKSLIVSKAQALKPIDIDLKETPDLFPLLAVLAGRAEGLSRLGRVSHLAFKESNRLDKIKELLTQLGINCWKEKDDFFVEGRSKGFAKTGSFVFDPKEDHRILMAGELVRSLQIPIELKNKDCVKKSFPEFYSYLNF